jgi:glycosyltransferase involved in cell wall biosynthesis
VLVYSTRRGAFDWLYLYQPGCDGLVAAAIARLCGRLVASEYVDMLSPEGYRGPALWLAYLTLAAADRTVPRLSHLIVVISTPLESRYHGWAPRASTHLMPVLVDTSAFRGGDPWRHRRELNIPQARIVVYTGSFTEPQGVENLLRAMVKVSRAFGDARLLIAGGGVGGSQDDVPALIRELGLEDVVLYLGHLGQSEVKDLQASADVLVMPKLDRAVNTAGLSTKLGEYLASGRPVVASRVGDVSLYLEDGVSALLCRAGDVDELAECIVRILSDRALAEALGRSGQQVASAQFDALPCTFRLAATMESIQLGRHGRPEGSVDSSRSAS